MNDLKTKPIGLLDQQLALSAYLDALLGDGPPLAVEPHPAPDVPAVPVAEARLVEVPAEAPVARSAPPLVAEPPLVRSEVPVPVEQVAPPQTPQSERPDWAQAEFQSLLFQVAGLTLAVPLAELNGVIPLDFDTVTPMPGHSALFLGLIERQDRQVRVVDTAQVVLPPDRLRQLGGELKERISHVVLIGEGRWGLAASGIGEVISLAPGDVKWRSSQGKRPWLAGTVVQHMCALLDVEAFIGLLKQGQAAGGVA